MRGTCQGAAALAAAWGALWGWGAAEAGFPSPADWRDVPVYQVFTDRFFDGDPTNNNAEGSYDPGDASGHPNTWSSGNVHGGDFAGVMDKLDYIQSLGFSAVWISPVQVNKNGAHHGYHAKDFMAIAPHFGTEAELRALADALHARGMYLILDVVCNHTGDFIGSISPGYDAFAPDPSPYSINWWNTERPAAPFNNLSWYRNNGRIEDYGDSVQSVMGELAGLDDLDTENPAVAQALVDAFTWLIDVSDCDGFRVDTVKHTDIGFWQTWCPAIHAHAASVGKNNFFLFGEVFDGSDYNVGKYTGTQSGGAFTHDSALYFPMHFTMRDVFAYDSPTRWLNYRYTNLGFYDPTAQEQLLNFLDNHDVSRFLSFGVANQQWDRLEAVLDFMTTTRGIPVVYQGTEQGFDGGSDPYDREDMWDGEWDYGPSVGDSFNMTHPLYLHLSRLMDIRGDYDALRTGSFTALDDDPSGPGIYAYRRVGASETVVVVVNSSGSTETSNPLASGWSTGTPISDLLDAGYSQSVGGGGSLVVNVPPRSARILVRTSAVAPVTPRVVWQSPAHDATLSEGLAPLHIGFSRAMNATTVEAAFSLTPPVAGTFSWAGSTELIFTPQVNFAAGATYALRIEASAQAADATPLRGAFETFFRSGTQTGVGDAAPAPIALRAFPNPAGERLHLVYELDRPGTVGLECFDIRGRRVAAPAPKVQSAGRGEVEWSRERLGLARGVYFVRLRVNGVAHDAVRVVWQ